MRIKERTEGEDFGQFIKLPGSAPTQEEVIETLKAEKQALEQQAAQTSTDLAGFMDYYFSKNPETPVV